MEIGERFTDEASAALREEIAGHGGGEVFAIGTLDGDGRVTGIRVVARGTESRVPALRPFAEKGDVVVHNHPSGTLKPSLPDVNIAAELGDRGVGFYIVDNRVKRLTVVAEPVPREELTPLDIPALKALLEPDGAFAKLYPDYEERETQIEMLGRVAAAFNDNKIIVAEAGTGVGKSLAYLIPAMFWVSQNRERVAVSTATINLQEQLLEKDIPLVQKMLPRRIEAALIKGRGNYLCRERLREALEENSLFEERNDELLAVKEWALTSPTGARTDLSFYPNDALWSEVCSEADACLGLRCSRREDCFVLRARRDAARARLLVVNHHLLLSDVSVRREGGEYAAGGVLPPFERVVFDEAHNVEKSATSFFSESMSKFTVRKIAGRLYRERRGRATGLALLLRRRLPDLAGLRRIPDLVKGLIEKAETLNACALGFTGLERSVGLADLRADDLKAGLFEPMRELDGAITDLVNAWEDIFNESERPVDEDDATEYGIRLALRRLLGVSSLVKQFLERERAGDKVFWLESFHTSRGDAALRFVVTPLDVAALMREAFYEPYRTIVFTSATLRVGAGFDFWKSRVGLKDYESRTPEEGVFPSPFPYAKRVLLAVPADAPQPDEEGYQAYLQETVLETLLVSEGRGLVLFTSYDLLNRVHLNVKDGLRKAGIEVLKQGDDERFRLLRRFNHETTSVLFATDSFWEGVDSPGETLEAVILCRLPFRVPTEPVTRARLERIRERGGNPFMELSLPDAVMRLRQGFGRLMRRKADKGVVLILDSRVLKKSYGRYFLESLPETARILNGRKAVIDRIESFFEAFRVNAEPPVDPAQ
ncbi:MAG: helicase c2 [Spirochaetales bacterium]|nr:helicase c2 [Spirochaetales bacterium]